MQAALLAASMLRGWQKFVCSLKSSVPQLSKQPKRKNQFPAFPLASVPNTEIEHSCWNDRATLSQPMLCHHHAGSVLPVTSSVLRIVFYPNNIRKQEDAAKFVLLIPLSLLYMFRVKVSHIFRSTLTVYTAFWNNVPTLLSAADKWPSLDGTAVKRINKTNFATSCWLLISLY